MYVCLCKGVTDKQIRQAVDNGVDSMRQLNRCLGVGSQCGKCGKHAKEVLREACTNSCNNELLLIASMA